MNNTDRTGLFSNYKPVVVTRGNFIILLQNNLSTLIVRYDGHIHKIQTFNMISYKDKHYQCMIDDFKIKGLSNLLTYRLDDKSMIECDTFEILSIDGKDPNLTSVVLYGNDYDQIMTIADNNSKLTGRFIAFALITGLILLGLTFVYSNPAFFVLGMFGLIILAIIYFVFSGYIFIDHNTGDKLSLLRKMNDGNYVPLYPVYVMNKDMFLKLCSIDSMWKHNFAFRYNGKVHYVTYTGDPKHRNRQHKFIFYVDLITIHGVSNFFNYEFEPGVTIGSLDQVEILMINDLEPKYYLTKIHYLQL